MMRRIERYGGREKSMASLLLLSLRSTSKLCNCEEGSDEAISALTVILTGLACQLTEENTKDILVLMG
jgi:hypothetical protein